MILSPETVLHAMSAVAGGPAPLHAPEISGNEWQYVKECLDTEWVSTAGAYVGRFEDMLTEFTGAGHAIATVNGTAALHACLLLAGVKPGDEVIVPALTFVATANAVFYAGAVPHFADAEEATLGLDPAKLDAHLETIAKTTPGGLINKATGRRISAVVCVHTFGHACDLDGLMAVCGRYGLPLIEDAAESLGSYYKDRHTGTVGLLSALSFNGNKIVTTGGGGAILTNDPKLADKARHLTTTAKQAHPWEFIHDEVGFNYRMPNVNAAIGCGQMEQLPRFLEQKRRLADMYRETLAGVEGIRFFDEPAQRRSNYWLNVLLMDNPDIGVRDDILKTLNHAGLMSRPAWRLMHQLEMYTDCPRMDLSLAEDLYARLINVPSSARLAAGDHGEA